ncbi:TRAP transporter substrate-binding protein [Spartinivicinus poritis]|uniref:TRAP transporter substrate-binding protein DctP n=1 Tax=Spartinivicinus poritis TaxID=2994640 RepID=A0ABT5UCM0_9GAMM|nr:TRAP transporter substrate-binding protein DctP [Spartinivicinus sp. A2-2]MDE1464125.1 TRAP transporter substrate-binding protein DctP [Spartinivicinus sp. A2-2]
MNRRSAIKYLLTIGASLTPTLAALSNTDPQFLKEEQKKAKLTKYIFNFASPYISDKHLTTPHAHDEIKQLIEQYTHNQVYVAIHDGGSFGIGSALSSSVIYGQVQGALLSISNLTPRAPAMDIINIPFWCASAERYQRLVNSKAWQQYVLSQAVHMTVLFHYVVGSRTASSTRIYGKAIKSPEDFSGVRFRVPASESLLHFYQMAGAKPTSILWGLAARTARLNRYDALDPSVIGLYSGPDELHREIGVITEIESVHDGWVAIANNHFIQALDKTTRIAFLDAIEEIRHKQLLLYQRSYNNCRQRFSQKGVKIYSPSMEEKEALKFAFGHQRKEWNSVKEKLLGPKWPRIFQQLIEATYS